MPLNRRQLITSAIGAAVGPAFAANPPGYAAKPHTAPSMDDLARVAALPVLKGDEFKTPVIIKSMELLELDKEYFVRVRSTNGAEGISVCNPPRADYFGAVFKDLLVPAFLKQDARAAVAIVDRAIALNPGSANVWFNGGFVRLLAGDSDLAVEPLENATRLDPMGPNRGARMLRQATGNWETRARAARRSADIRR